MIATHNFAEHGVATDGVDGRPPSAVDMKRLGELRESALQTALEFVRGPLSPARITPDKKLEKIVRDVRKQSLRERIAAQTTTTNKSKKLRLSADALISAREPALEAARAELRRLNVGVGMRSTMTAQSASVSTAISAESDAVGNLADAKAPPDDRNQFADRVSLGAARDSHGVAFGLTREQREALAKDRPARFRTGVVEAVWKAAQGADGKVRDPNTLKELSWDRSKNRDGQWDMGHIAGQSYDDLKDQFLNGEISRKQFLDEYNNPANYFPEDRSSNRSRRYQ